MSGKSPELTALRRLKQDSLNQVLDIEETQSIGTAILDHILPIADIPTKVMIVDNCSERADWKPQLVENELEKLYRTEGESQAYIFNLDDIPDSEEKWVTHEYKFRLLADFVTAILVFLEPHRNQPRLTEFSVLASTPRYWEKTIVLECVIREDTSAPFHSELYDELQNQDQYFTYHSIAELAKTCCEIYEEIPVLQ